MISISLFELMGLNNKIHPTSFSFYGVGEESMKFAGMVHGLSV